MILLYRCLMKITVVLLTWQRISSLKTTLARLANQTHKHFDVHISNSNEKASQTVEKYAKYFEGTLSITVSHDSNDLHAYRRLTVARELAKGGTEVILFIDDDVTISNSYIEDIMAAYEPNSYSSAYAWIFTNNGQDYYKHRKRVRDNLNKIHYCGSAVSVIDASIFLYDDLFVHPEEAYLMEDLWLSYFAQQVKGWKLKYAHVNNLSISGSDANALYKKIMREKKINGTPDKADLLRKLVNDYGWKL